MPLCHYAPMPLCPYAPMILCSYVPMPYHRWTVPLRFATSGMGDGKSVIMTEKTQASD